LGSHRQAWIEATGTIAELVEGLDENLLPDAR